MAIVATKTINNFEEKSKRLSFRSENKKPWMLRDYLRDDMSSCSSNGFRSFPRKQCCIAVKNMIEIEVNRAKPPRNKLLLKNRHKNRNVSSALHRASMAVINAVKLIPFTSASASNGVNGRRFLLRSFSKKLFNRSFFWKKSSSGERNGVVLKSNDDDDDDGDEIERWISSGVVATEKYQPLDLSNDTSVTTNSNNSTDGGKSSSDCWSEITFSSDYLPSLGENDVVKRSEKVKGKSGEEEEEVVSQSVGVLTGDATPQPAVIQKTWCNEEAEIEQLSPISVMDFPCNDDGSASPFTLRVSRLKGTKERLLEKLGRFESLASGLGLDPVNLETLMSSATPEDESQINYPPSCSTPSFILSSESDSSSVSEEEEKDVVEEEEEEQSLEDEEEMRVQNLLSNIINLRKPNDKLEYENLLLNFFHENVAQRTDESLLKSAKEWLNGHYDTLILGWEVKDKRQAYIRDMEKRGRWPKDCKLEKEDVALELEAEVFKALIDEMVLELC